MEKCLNHPEVPTSRRCELCGVSFCGACLELAPSLGPVCAECETELETLQDQSEEAAGGALQELKGKIRRSIPPSRPWWGWEFMFWTAVLLPSFVVGTYLLQLYQYHRILSLLSQEPILPSITVRRLTQVASAVESYRMAHGDLPRSLKALEEADGIDDQAPEDPYSPENARFIYRWEEDQYQVCSLGPDRRDDTGARLDRITGQGDICVGPLRNDG